MAIEELHKPAAARATHAVYQKPAMGTVEPQIDQMRSEFCRNVRPDRKRIREGSDQGLEFFAYTKRSRHPDAERFLAAVTMEQRRECGKKRHVQRGRLVSACYG